MQEVAEVSEKAHSIEEIRKVWLANRDADGSNWESALVAVYNLGARGSRLLEPGNCPLVTGLRPCECSLPRCPKCGYTAHDARFEGDHFLCSGTIPGAGTIPVVAKGASPLPCCCLTGADVGVPEAAIAYQHPDCPVHNPERGLSPRPMCKAAAGATDPPQDCDWPFCGCDDAATKALEALREMGWGRVEAAYQEGWEAGHSQGISCGHPLNSCHCGEAHVPDKGWRADWEHSQARTNP